MSLMLVAFAVLLVSVPLARGQLRHCVDVEFRHTWALLASLGSQFLVLRVLRGVLAPDVLGLLHVGTYFFAGAFVWLNRAIPGIVLMALGGAANLAAISSNGGVMPAQPHALEVAGKPVDPSYFVNSGVVPDANLWFLGDIFAIPASWPFANVFSVGDVLLVVGAVIGIHRICQSRLVPSGASEFSSLRRQASFMRVWGTFVCQRIIADRVNDAALRTKAAWRPHVAATSPPRTGPTPSPSPRRWPVAPTPPGCSSSSSSARPRPRGSPGSSAVRSSTASRAAGSW
jgi:hypothetical protein